MHLTRRGYGLVALVVVAGVLAFSNGSRALNAIAAPAVVALVVAAVRVRRIDEPTFDCERVSPGFPGDSREVTVAVDGDGVATLEMSVPEGLAVEGDRTQTSLPAEVVTEVTFVRRGRHVLGPLQVRVTDALGLVAETYHTRETIAALVYPPVYLLAGRERILSEVIDRDAVERQEFDSLREYTPGDPLRNVHWKTTAKDPQEMYVTEFADRRIEDSVVLAATADPGYADDMAAAAASVAVMALDVDVNVELRVPARTVSSGQGADQRERILRTLALTDAGNFPGAADADLRVHADADGVTLTVGSRDHPLDEMTVSHTNPLVDRGVAT